MANAVIDIGTNTVILLVAETQKTGLKIIHDEAHITRLGQGLSETHFFNPQAIKRTLDVLTSYAATCKKLKVKKIAVVGTAACRNAATCLGEPQARGDAPCLAPLTPWALGHAADHWAYADWLLRRFVPAARR